MLIDIFIDKNNLCYGVYNHVLLSEIMIHAYYIVYNPITMHVYYRVLSVDIWDKNPKEQYWYQNQRFHDTKGQHFLVETPPFNARPRHPLPLLNKYGLLLSFS